jgi:hypothetical protein
MMMTQLKKKNGIMKPTTSSSKYDGEKSRVVVTWSAVLMYLQASLLPLAIVLFLCHFLRTFVLVFSDYTLAEWSMMGLSLRSNSVFTLNDTNEHILLVSVFIRL